MLSLAATFLIIALIAAAVAFGGLAGTSIAIPKLLFWAFIVLFVLALVGHMLARRRPPAPPV